MSYFCYVHNWASPTYSCPQCHKTETFTTNSAIVPGITITDLNCPSCKDLRQRLAESEARVKELEGALELADKLYADDALDVEVIVK